MLALLPLPLACWSRLASLLHLAALGLAPRAAHARSVSTSALLPAFQAASVADNTMYGASTALTEVELLGQILGIQPTRVSRTSTIHAKWRAVNEVNTAYTRFTSMPTGQVVWPPHLQAPKKDHLILLYGTKPATWYGWQKIFKDVALWPAMEKWLNDEEDKPAQADVWGKLEPSMENLPGAIKMYLRGQLEEDEDDDDDDNEEEVVPMKGQRRSKADKAAKAKAAKANAKAAKAGAKASTSKSAKKAAK